MDVEKELSSSMVVWSNSLLLSIIVLPVGSSSSSSSFQSAPPPPHLPSSALKPDKFRYIIIHIRLSNYIVDLFLASSAPRILGLCGWSAFLALHALTATDLLYWTI
jgi:hypothetical protein